MDRRPLGSLIRRAHNSRVRSRQRFAWLGVIDGVLVAVLLRGLAFDEGPHQPIDVAAMLTLLLGFLGAAPAALRSLRRDGTSQSQTDFYPWFTMLAYGALMIALTGRWAFLGAPYTVLGGVTLSILMLGFLRHCAAIVESLGASSFAPGSAPADDSQDALLLFPAEDAGANDWRHA